jgi:hypothetical protein
MATVTSFYRVTLLMNGGVNTGLAPSGWSEHYDGTFSDQTTAFSAGNKLANRRLSFLGSQHSMYGYRVSLVTAQAKKSPATGYRFHQASVQICGWGVNRFGQATYGTDPYHALYYRAYAATAPGKPSKREFRGWPASWYISPGAIAVAKSEAELQSFFAFLQSWTWLKFVLNPTSGVITSYPWTCMEFQRLAKKATGRPFGLVRGKRFSHHAKPS